MNLSEKKLLICISTFDSVDFVKLWVDLIYNIFGLSNIDLLVSFGEPNIEDELNKILKIKTIRASNIPNPVANTSSFKAVMGMRVYESIRRGLQYATKHQYDAVMHTHSDSFILDGSILQSLFAQSIRSGKVLCRGRGFAWCGSQSPLGVIDDHFLFIPKTVLEKGISKISALELCPNVNNVHGMLSTVLVGGVGLRNVCFHSNIRDLVYWDDKPIELKGNFVKPSSLDRNLGLLHVNVGSFPEHIGYSILAKYLSELDLSNSEDIKNFVSRFDHLDDKMLQKLTLLEKKQDFILRLLLFDIRYFGRDFTHKKKVIKQLKLYTPIMNIGIRFVRLLRGRFGYGHRLDPRILRFSIYPDNYSNYLASFNIDEDLVRELKQNKIT